MLKKTGYKKLFILLILMILLPNCGDQKKEKFRKLEFSFDKDNFQASDSLNTEKHDIQNPFLISGEIPKGGILAQVLKENELNGNDVYEAVNTLNSIFDLRHVQPGDKFQVMTDSTGMIYEMTFYRNPIKKYMVFRDSNGKMAASIKEEKLTRNVEMIEGVLESSLYKTVLDAGEEPALAMMFTQIFQWDIDFFIDPRQGDKIRILFEKYSLNGDNVHYGNILCAAYTSKTFESTAYRYTDSKGASKYYDEKGVCFQKAFLKSPLNFTRITSKFGRRIHPITKKPSMHNGVDYAAPYGTPVEAAADGVVAQAKWNPGHTGNTVIIRHPNGYKTLYGHLSKYGKFKAGQKVKQHDVIGYVGSTGRSTGNHLHYTIFHYDKPIDPLKLKNVAGPPVSSDEIPAFKLHVDSLKTLLFQETKQESITETELMPDSAFITEITVMPEAKEEHENLNVLLIVVIIEFLIILFLLVLLVLKRRNSIKIIE